MQQSAVAVIIRTCILMLICQLVLDFLLSLKRKDRENHKV